MNKVDNIYKVLGLIVLICSIGWNIRTYFKNHSSQKEQVIIEQERKYQHDKELNLKVDMLVKAELLRKVKDRIQDSLKQVQDRNLSDTLKLISNRTLSANTKINTVKNVMTDFLKKAGENDLLNKYYELR